MSQPAIAVQGLCKRFGKRAVVDGLSFEVPTGSVCGFFARTKSANDSRLWCNTSE